MSQSSFGFAEKERDQVLFFGVILEADTALNVDQFSRSFCAEHHVAGTPRGRKRFHISLHSAGAHTHLPTRVIYAAKLAGKAVAIPPFDVTLHSIMSFPRRSEERRPLVLLAEGAGLTELHGTLAAAMSKIGLRTRKHFTPHVTVLYGPDTVPRQAIAPIRFVVRDFSFIHSMWGLSRYETIDRWPLLG